MECKSEAILGCREDTNRVLRFRYVALQTLEFKPPVTPNSIEEVLKNLPLDLDQTYERVLCRLSGRQQQVAICALRWIAFSRTPLSRDALVEAILVDMANTSQQLEDDMSVEQAFSQEPFDEDDRFEPVEVKDLLPGLLEEREREVDEWGSTVLVSPGRRPVRDPVIVATHFSLVEYLISQRIQSGTDAVRAFALDRETANSQISGTCLRYLGFAAERGTAQVEAILVQFPFASYAASNGLWHAEASDHGRWPARLRRLIAHTLFSKRDSKTWTILLKQLPPPPSGPSPDSAVLYAISQELWQVASFLVETASIPADLDSPDTSHGRTPLSWAAGRGKRELVNLLLQNGVNPDSRARYGRTPLSYAAGGGHKKVVECLLNLKDVDPDSKSQFWQTPLYKAAMGGHTSIVEMLLHRGADPDTLSRFGQTPLIWAAARGHGDTVRLLLSTGRVNINTMDEEHQTPLAWASAGGHLDVVKLLLGANAWINTKDIFGRTPLEHAHTADADDVVRTLAEAIMLARGGDPENLRHVRTDELVPPHEKTHVPTMTRDSPTILPRHRLDSSRLEKNEGLKLSLPIPGEKQATSLRDLLEAAAKRSLFNNRSFFPRKVLVSVLTRQRVLADMSKYLTRSDAMNALEKVCPIQAHDGSDEGDKSDKSDKSDDSSPGFLKIYAILVLMERQADIIGFFSNGFSDLCLLPFGRSQEGWEWRDDDWGSRADEMPPQFPNGWSVLAKLEFSRLQWEFCPPYFDASDDSGFRVYHFNEKLILPFVGVMREEGLGDSSIWDIKSGSPVKIEIDPSSHAFQPILRKVSSLFLKNQQVRVVSLANPW